MCKGERRIGAAKGKQTDTMALCQPPPLQHPDYGPAARFVTASFDGICNRQKLLPLQQPVQPLRGLPLRPPQLQCITGRRRKGTGRCEEATGTAIQLLLLLLSVSTEGWSTVYKWNSVSSSVTTGPGTITKTGVAGAFDGTAVSARRVTAARFQVTDFGSACAKIGLHLRGSLADGESPRYVL